MIQEKFKWKLAKYGGSMSCNLGHGFKLVARYPLVGKQYESIVNGLTCGYFNSQEDAMKTCEKVALSIIKNLHKRFIGCGE